MLICTYLIIIILKNNICGHIFKFFLLYRLVLLLFFKFLLTLTRSTLLIYLIFNLLFVIYSFLIFNLFVSYLFFI